MDIQPGQMVKVEIANRPKNDAATKTLYRVLRKDADVNKAHRTRKRQRPSWQEWRRGGKMWHHQMKSRPMISLEPGATYTLRASTDVIRDLKSVAQCVKVDAA